jgi:hypothetical protein
MRHARESPETCEILHPLGRKPTKYITQAEELARGTESTIVLLLS